MRYAGIIKQDITNGPGIRTTLYVQGCPHHCEGCFNESSWNYSGGKEWTNEKKTKFLEIANHEAEYKDGITLLGGDPLAVNDDSILELLSEYKAQSPDKTVWIWTGYTWEEILYSDDLVWRNRVSQILKYVDVLVDGRFVERLFDPNLKWRGSFNQRFIDVQKSLETKSIRLVDIMKYN